MPPKRAAATAASAATKKTAVATTTTKKTTATTATKKTTTAAATKKTVATTKKAAAAPKKAAAAPKKAAPKKAAPKKKTVAEVAPESDKENTEEPEKKVVTTKRKRTQDDEEQAPVASSSEDEIAQEPVDAQAQPAKKRKVAAPKAPAAKRPARVLKAINEKPERVLDMFVFGEGTAGELGLGSVKVDGKKPIDVKRPRLNPNVSNVVQIACGGMHVAALTKDNKIFTWGVNDQGALGRDTTWDGGLRDVEDEDDDSDDEDDTGMNPKESTPAEIDTSGLPEGIEWVQVVASDSATFALTTTGQVYGWGTFRVRHNNSLYDAILF